MFLQRQQITSELRYYLMEPTIILCQSQHTHYQSFISYLDQQFNPLKPSNESTIILELSQRTDRPNTEKQLELPLLRILSNTLSYLINKDTSHVFTL